MKIQLAVVDVFYFESQSVFFAEIVGEGMIGWFSKLGSLDDVLRT